MRPRYLLLALFALPVLTLLACADEEPTAPAAAPPIVQPVETGPVARFEPPADPLVVAVPKLRYENINESLLTKAKVQKIARPKVPRRRTAKGSVKLKASGSYGLMGKASAAKPAAPKPMQDPAPATPKEVQSLLGGLGYGGGGAKSASSFAKAGPSPKAQAEAQGGGRGKRPVRRQRDDLAGREQQPDAPNVRYLSADDSNSAASPALVRQTILAGRYVDPSIVRAYEFLNYHSFEYAAPQDDGIAIDAQMRPTDNPRAFSVQVAVRGPQRTRAEMAPMHAVILLDASGSMAGRPDQLARAFVRGFVDQLRPDDHLSLVVSNRKAQTLLTYQAGSEGTSKLVEASLAELTPNDVTNLEKGLVEAYRIAVAHKADGQIARVIVISDGAANFGRLSRRTIEKHAADGDEQGIYLAGIGVGSGFEDRLMDSFTDRGRGAYLFIDRQEEVRRALTDDQFVANFDVALKDVRLKMEMPRGWTVKAFHGEQISRKKSKVTPQYLSPNDQMIYHLLLEGDAVDPAGSERFHFEAEFTPIGGERETYGEGYLREEMLTGRGQIIKGNALVAFAESLRKVKFPLEEHRDENLTLWDLTADYVNDAADYLEDPELQEVVRLVERYRQTLEDGETFPGARDKRDTSPDAVLGIPTELVQSVEIRSAKASKAVKGLTRLLNSRKLVPMEGYRFLAMSTGPVGSPNPAGSGDLRSRRWPDPQPRYMGHRRVGKDWRGAHDLTQITIELTAPAEASSFSFDFNYLSAEYPAFVNQDYNDTFYAILEAQSTNQGKRTNISFDANNKSIEVDNNYFENQFHPIPNVGTGFDQHGSTGWLRTSWPIEPGETFKVTFSIHDEGDGIYDSMVLLDNFRFHAHAAVGTTDPLN
jgi:Ca-activated chloride channel homolog